MPSLFVSALLLGLVFSATPGAVNAESLRRGVAGGFQPALLVQLGSLTGDLVWAALALTGTAVLIQHRSWVLFLGLVGSLFLLRQAVIALRGAAQPSAIEPPARVANRSFVTGAAFSLANPFALAFWVGLGAGVAATAHSGPGGVALFFAGFFVGAVLWCLSFAAAVSAGRLFVTPFLLRVLDGLCGVALGYFGIRLLVRTMQALRMLRLARAVLG